MESALLDFAASFPADTAVAGPGANAAQANAALRLEVLGGGEARSLALKAPAGRWDVSDHLYLAVALRNAGGHEAVVSVEVDSEGAGAWSNRNDVSTVLTPGQAKTVKVLIVRPPLDADGELARFFAGNDGEAGASTTPRCSGCPAGSRGTGTALTPARSHRSWYRLRTPPLGFDPDQTPGALVRGLA